MADYYAQFSYMIKTKDETEREWLKRMAQALEDAYGEEQTDELPDNLVALLTDWNQPIEDLYPPNWELDNQGLWLHNDESCGHEFAALISQAYLKKFHPDGCLGFEIGNTCSKARLDGFGGSACFITADGVEWYSTWRWLEEQREEHRPRKEK